MSAGACCGGECQLCVGGGCVAGSGVAPGRQDQDDGVVEGSAPGVALAVRVTLAAAMFGASGAELAEGDGIAAGLGEEVAAVAEHVRPLAQPGPGRGEPAAAELPGGGDHLGVVTRAAQDLQ